MYTSKSVYIGVLLALAALDLSAAVGSVTLTHANVKVESSIINGKLVERFWAKGNAGWVLVAASDGKTQGALSIRASGGSALPATVQSVTQDHAAIVEELQGDGWTIKKRIEPFGVGNWLRVSAVFTPHRSQQLHSFVDEFRTNLKPDWSFSPSIGGFNPDAKYKSALVFVQQGPVAFGVVPDLTSLDRATLQRCNHALDLDVTGNAKLSVGFVPAKASYHVVFKEDLDRNWLANESVSNIYYLYLSANATVREAYRETVRLQWSQFGRGAQAEAADEQAGTGPKYERCHLWDEWRHVVWEQESRESWLTVPLAGSITGGAVLMRRAHSPKPSLYLGAWFNSLRTSYGMALYARRTENAELLALAQQTVTLALNAPGRDGAFKCFAVPKDSGDTGKADEVFWGAGDGAGTSVSEGYLGFDMSWTCYWLLKWHEAGLPGGEGILPRCTRLADFLIARQKPDGSLPTRFDDAGQVQEDLSATVAGETAPVVRFLFELAKVEKSPKYRRAALRGLAYLDRFIVPERKWYDFETFWSCSPRLVAFDERTHQWPANNLALIHAVAAYLQAYQITGQRTYLTKGQSLLDYLLLYQQTWTNPVLENLHGHSMLLGGFTTQNSDAEWSDARQSLAGEVLMDYYRATGNIEYLERGVAALRSQFPVSPSENWAHTGYGHKAGVSSFHWGTGSGMAGIELEEEYLRDAVCDLHAKRCVGVNGLNLTKWEISSDGRIDLQANSPYQWNRKPKFVFHGAHAKREYKVSINGAPPQTFSGDQLEAGVGLDASLRSDHNAEDHRR